MPPKGWKKVDPQKNPEGRSEEEKAAILKEAEAKAKAEQAEKDKAEKEAAEAKAKEEAEKAKAEEAERKKAEKEASAAMSELEKARGYGALPPDLTLAKREIKPKETASWLPILGDGNDSTVTNDWIKTGFFHWYTFPLNNKVYSEYAYTEEDADKTLELKKAAAKHYAKLTK